jgi:uncharacterized protein (DUF2252 family)
MNIVKATRRYERWLAGRMPIIPSDLRAKHEAMSRDVFPFLRATFYRWVQVMPEVCHDLMDAPQVLGVGDLHVENFGTWRDIEGRLIWGVNDFDEAYPMPFTVDLVRLAASALLASGEEHIAIDGATVCDAILEGYLEGIRRGGHAFVLAETHDWLYLAALSHARNAVNFWNKIDALRTVPRRAVREVEDHLRELMPAPNLPSRIAHRRAGLGSLGRRRYTMIAQWGGARVAREAKELTASAWQWLHHQEAPNNILYEQIVSRAVRVADPYLHVRGKWIIRRLSPDCSRIELSHLSAKRDEVRLLNSMGFETANIHLGSPKAIRHVSHYLVRRKANWLYKAANDMAEATRNDWAKWHKRAG